jgi:hypothetical protein
MASKAKAGTGTKLKLGDGASPEVFTTVAEITSLKMAGRTVKTDDVTNMDSPTDSNGLLYEEFIATVASSGGVDFTYNFTPNDTAQQAVRTAFDGKLHNFQIVTVIDKTGSSPLTKWTFSFAAIVEMVDGVDFPVDKKVSGTGKLKISGPISMA